MNLIRSSAIAWCSLMVGCPGVFLYGNICTNIFLSFSWSTALCIYPGQGEPSLVASISPKAQIYILLLSASFPLASLGILPNAILAEIAQRDAKRTGENREGMFFAVKYLFVKLGQTMGIALFAFLTVYGRDPGHDRGLRMNGICGFVLCLLAFVFFTRFKEVRARAAIRG